MPTHTIHSALVSMYHAAEGAPWSYLKWQETTGVGYGLFPGEDDQLPQNWTRQTAEDIRSYFKMYKEKRKEADRVAFSSSRASHIPGLQFWRTWVRQLWKEKGMQSRITSVLSEENLHPIVLMRHSTDQKWPQGAMYAVQAADAVGLELFGEDAMDGLGHVHANIKPSVTAIIQRTWNNLNTQYKRSVSRIGDLEEKAIVAFEGMLTFPVFDNRLGIDDFQTSTRISSLKQSSNMSFKGSAVGRTFRKPCKSPKTKKKLNKWKMSSRYF